MGYGRWSRAALATVVLLGGLTAFGSGGARAAATDCATARPPDATGPGVTKIMIAGDSVTNESAGDYTWRYRFFKDVTRNGAKVDLVGTFDDTIDPVTLTGGDHRYVDCAFDWDHEARPGAKLLDYGGKTARYNFYPAASSSWIHGAVTAKDPDVLLMFVGTNDLLRITDEITPAPSNDAVAQIVLARAKKVVDEARVADPDLQIFFMTMLPANPVLTPNSARFTKFNQLIEEAAPGWGPTFHLVTPPDFTGNGHTWDGGHPDAVGEVQLAKAFTDALHEVMPQLPASSSEPLPPIGPRFPAALSPGTVGATSLGISWVNPAGAGRTQISVRDVTAGVPADPDVGWTLEADLTWAAFHQYFPNVGTGYCPAYCTTHTFTDLEPEHTYQVRLRSGKGLAVAQDITSNVVSATTLPAGAVAQVITKGASGFGHGVTVSWVPVVEAVGYRVYWRKVGAAAWSGPAPTNAITFSRSITGLAPATYELAVAAVTAQPGEGPRSVPIRVTAKYYVLAAVPKPKLKAVAGHRLRATWVKRAGATRYLVQVRVGGRLVRSAFATRTTWTSPRLKKGTRYAVRVRPYDGPYGGGFSASSTIRVR